MPNFHQINCGDMTPHFFRVKAGIYVTLFETNLGWVLIDSGYGTQDFLHPDAIMRIFTTFTRTALTTDQCVIKQIQQIGLKPDQIKHIILTHLHIDHAGGIADFPWSTVHVSEKEYQSAIRKAGRLGVGYNRRQWLGHPTWQRYQQTDSSWFGIPAMMLPGFTPEIYLIPMPGHTPGHCMVAFANGEKWVLQTGSAAYPFYLPEEQQARAPGWFKRWLMGNNLDLLKQLWQEHGSEIQFLSSHEFRARDQ